MILNGMMMTAKNMIGSEYEDDLDDCQYGQNDKDNDGVDVQDD